jgi:hypothetical protein
MNKNIGMTLILILSLIILLYYTNRISRERFENSEDLYKMGISNEKFGKFCQKLKLLDKPNEYNNILNKMRKETSKKNEDIIGELLEEINKVQKGIIENDIDIKNKYKLYTHNKADKQEKVIKTALDNVKNKDKLFVNLV